MTNEEWVRGLPTELLAGLLIHIERELDCDPLWIDYASQIGWLTYYVTSDGQRFWNDYDKALQHECWWLSQEFH